MKYPITKIDWNAFQYMFSPDPRTAFQQLTEQLFCFEFHQPYGVYRYYNQPYVETMPVRYGEIYVGFQSKYYDAQTPLLSKKNELISAITGAHQKYPDINEMVFYINKEPGISTVKGKSKPVYIEEIEHHGDALGIQIQWRGPNQIETMLLQPELNYIRDYFFATDGGIRQTLDQLTLHKKSIFDSISFNIPYKGNSIKLNRDHINFSEFMNSNRNIILVHGEGGCGKSGLIKEQLAGEKQFPVWIFRATDFDYPSLSEFTQKFGDCTWDDLLASFDGISQKLCIVDSAEKVFTIEHLETFREAVRLLLQHGWQLVITIRTAYKDNFHNAILQADVTEYQVKKLTIGKLTALEHSEGFQLPADYKLRDFLCNLFYLKLYLSGLNTLTSNNVIEFRNNIWNEVICASSRQKESLHIRRGQTICNLVRTNADNGTTYYTPRPEDDWGALSSLAGDDIIHYDDAMAGYFITHDVYEEIVLLHILNQAYRQKQTADSFFQTIGDSLIVRKAFRLWLHNQFEDRFDEIAYFLSDVLMQRDVNAIWRDEILIALMGEDDVKHLSFLDDLLKEQNYQLFARALALLNTACRTVDTKFWRQILSEEEMKRHNIYRWTNPSGAGWNYLISYAYTHRENIPWSPVVIMLTIDVVCAWTSYMHKGETTRNAGLMALYLYQLVEERDEYRYQLKDERIGRIDDAILNSAMEILPELTPIFESVIDKGTTGHRELYSNLCEHLLSNVSNCGTMCAAAPEIVFKLAKLFWLKQEPSREWLRNSPSVSEDFGLNYHIEHNYYPESAFQTPVFALLQAEPIKTIDFIIDLFNDATEVYKNSDLNEKYKECSEIELLMPNGCKIIQTASERLWNMYRGTSVAPGLLESVLMALERWLYFVIPDMSMEHANSLCIRLLSKSKTVAITAVVVSIVTAYPEQLFQIACILLHAKETFMFDIVRLSHEHSANFLKGISRHSKLYDDERIESNKLPFRQKRLEDAIVRYQLETGSLTESAFEERRQKLYQAIDESFQPENLLKEDERFLLYRIDLRKMKLVQEKEDQIALVSDLPESLVQSQQRQHEVTKNDDVYIQLFLWSHGRFDKKNSDYLKCVKYETEPETALQDALAIINTPSLLGDGINLLVYVSSILLVDFIDQISKEAIRDCADIITKYLLQTVDKQGVYVVEDGTEAAIAVLPTLITYKPERPLPIEPAYLLLMLICDWGKQRDWAVSCLREHIWRTNRELALKIVLSYIYLKPKYDIKVSIHGRMKPTQFFDSHATFIDTIMQKEPGDIPTFNDLSDTALQTLCLLFPFKDPLSEHVLIAAGELFWKTFFENRKASFKEGVFRDSEQENLYLNWLVDYLLHSPKDTQNNILSSLKQYLGESDITKDFFATLIMREDRLKIPCAFWHIWDELFDVVEKLCSKRKDTIVRGQGNYFEQYYMGVSGEILVTYLLAFPLWSEEAHSWHTLSIENSSFFTKAVNQLGYHPGTLYGVARVLNTIGYNYLEQGISWLATIIHNNTHLLNCPLEVNTEYYIEECLQRYISANRIKIMHSPEVRRNVLDTLSFLVSRGSTCAFMLRESIC